MPNWTDPRGSFVTVASSRDCGDPPRDYAELSSMISCNEGIVCVVPDPEPERIGSIWLPDEAQRDRRPDTGYVVSSGVDDLSPGDRVIYAPWGGAWFRPFTCGRTTVRDVRFYGMLAPSDPSLVEREPIEDSIVAKCNGSIEPIRDWVLIRRDPVRTDVMGIELPDDVRHRTLKATVVSAGPIASVGPSRLSPGDRVIYNPMAIVVGLKELGDGDRSLALIRSGNILARILE